MAPYLKDKLEQNLILQWLQFLNRILQEYKFLNSP